MKTFRLGLTFASALFCASTARTQSLLLSPPPNGISKTAGYLPKLAGVALYTLSGEFNNQTTYGTTVSIFETGTNNAALQVEAASSAFSYCCDSFSWDPPPTYITSPTQPSDEIGHAPSIAMTPCGNVCGTTPPNNTNLVEVHQGGQDNGSELWYRT